MKLTELFLNRFLYKDTTQNLETKDSVFVSADSTPSEPAPIPSGGAAQDINISNVTIDGAQLTPGSIPPATLDVSNWGWGQTCAFTSTDSNTVSWGAGTFKSANGVSYSISAGNTGNMAGKTYVYLDLLTSSTTYQTTTTPATAVGVGKVLIAVANPDTTTATYNLSEATQIVGDNILANTINASKITTGQLIVGSNVGQGTARQNFYATPTTPYYVNDLWTNGTDIKVCTTQRLTGAYNAADWGAASDYKTSTGVTTIIGDTVTTGFINALSVTAGSVAAENITGTTITGKTVRTASSGQRVVLDGSNNYISIFDSSRERIRLSNEIIASYNSGGTEVGRSYTSGTDTSFYVSAIGSTLNSNLYLRTSNGVISFLVNGTSFGYFGSTGLIMQSGYSVNADYFLCSINLRLTSTSTPDTTDGSIYFNGTHFYGRISGAWKQLDN